MFKEFNVEFQDVEMIGGADNLLENTKVTKVVMSGDNKMSSLDSTFKNCSELDNIQGGLNLNGISNINNILEGNNLVKSINLENINNENISVNNSFPNVEEISIGGDLYSKKAVQNVIASKEWTFNNINYVDAVGDNVVTKSVNLVDSTEATINDTLEQKVKGIEIIGQTYDNLIESNVEYKLTDTYSTTWIEGTEYIENMPSMIEISEIFGNTVQDENDLSVIDSVGELYVDEEGDPILDDGGNEQHRLELVSSDGNGNSNKTTLLLPQPLRKVGNYSDRLYWDNNKNKFLMDIGTQIVKAATTSNYVLVEESDEFVTVSLHHNYLIGMSGIGSFCSLLSQIKSYNATEEGFCYVAPLFYFTLRKNKLDNSAVGYALAVRNWLVNNNATFTCPKKSEKIETKILEKPTLETYSPKTYISTNTEVQPSQITITNKETIIVPMFLDECKKYTVKFNCNKKGDNPVKINLGGTEAEIDAILGENSVEIITPQVISEKELVLSGEGNVITDVFVIADNMSTGELQDDGTYKIDISTTSQTDSYDISIIANKPLGTDEKLYWNKSNKRYEIDRNGEIGIPTVEGDIIDLPRIYQRQDTLLTVSAGNIKPSEIKVEYKDLN